MGLDLDELMMGNTQGVPNKRIISSIQEMQQRYLNDYEDFDEDDYDEEIDLAQATEKTTEELEKMNQALNKKVDSLESRINELENWIISIETSLDNRK